MTTGSGDRKMNPRSTAISRRHLLQIGGLGLAGLTLPKLLASQANAAAGDPAPRADSCIIIFLNGGPPHLDMWDMKPDQPAEIRGEFSPISTSLPGYQVSDQLPRLATQMHLATVVRSMHHSVNNSHAAAVYAALTGHDRGEQGGGARPTDHPAPGSVLAMMRPPEQRIVPFVHLPFITKEGAGGPPQPGFFGGLIGQSHDPLFVLNDPNAADFAIPELTLERDVSERRLSERRSLLTTFDREMATTDKKTRATEMNGFQQLALDLLTSEATQRAFRLSEEPANVRDSYGRNRYGQSTLLARRLLEAGTRLVTLSWAPDANATWDTHGNNFKRLRGDLLPQFDSACTSLIFDLAERGLLDRTLVAVFGDFGRSPKVNAAAGRDHWNYCYSLMMVGGGFQPGLIYGESDRTGAFPKSDPLGPGDIISTMYHVLGIRPDRDLHDSLNRPHRLVPSGAVVSDLLT